MANRVGTKPPPGSVHSAGAVFDGDGVAAGTGDSTLGDGGATDGDGEAATAGVVDGGAGSASVCPPRGIRIAMRATTASAAARTMSNGRRDRFACGSVVTRPAYAVARPGRNGYGGEALEGCGTRLL